jgi:hypothetical protein
MKRKAARERRGASRRDFLKVIAAGTAAAMVGPVAGLADEASEGVTASGSKREARATVRVRSREIEKGIEDQKGYLLKTAETIRAYDLPTNSEQAMVFTPLRAPKRRSK